MKNVALLLFLLAAPAQAQATVQAPASAAGQQQVAQARIAVIIPEVILRRPVPDPAVETELLRALTQGGFRVVDPGTQQRNAQRDLLRSQDAASVPDLQARLSADYLVTGEAFAEEYGAVAGGLRGYTARVEVKVIDLASGHVVFSEAYQGSGTGMTDAIAGKTALMRVGQLAARQLPQQLAGVLQGRSSVAQRAFVVKVQAPVTFDQVSALVTALNAAGLKEVNVRSIDGAGAVLELAAEGKAADVARLLAAQGLTVSGLTGNEITVRY